jgi:hypothetical protein
MEKKRKVKIKTSRDNNEDKDNCNNKGDDFIKIMELLFIEIIMNRIINIISIMIKIMIMIEVITNIKIMQSTNINIRKDKIT